MRTHQAGQFLARHFDYSKPVWEALLVKGVDTEAGAKSALMIKMYVLLLLSLSALCDYSRFSISSFTHQLSLARTARIARTARTATTVSPTGRV